MQEKQCLLQTSTLSLLVQIQLLINPPLSFSLESYILSYMNNNLV